MKVSVPAANGQAALVDDVVIGAEEKVDMVSGARELSAVITAEGAATDHRDLHPRKEKGTLTRVRVPSGKRGSYLAPRMASLAALATRNLTTRLAGIWMVSPVMGLRPWRALRLT